MKISRAGLSIGEVAAALGISTQAVRNRVKRTELQGFFSANAKSSTGHPAVFSEEDWAIMVTVDALLKEGDDWQDIAAKLQSGYREDQPPENAAIVATTTNTSLQLAGRALSAEDRLATLQERVDEQSATIRELTDRLIDNERAHSRDIERIMRELSDAKAEKAAAERELELLRKGWRPPVG